MASYHGQLTADIKMKNYMIKTSFASPDWSKARANKIGINFMISIIIFVRDCLYYNSKQHFSVWLRTGSNPADINRFRSHTGKVLLILFTKIKAYFKIEPYF